MKNKLVKQNLDTGYHIEYSITEKFGKPCKKCKGYHNTIATMGDNVASGTRKEQCAKE